MSVSPFRYPSTAHVRRHGPAGYSTYQQFRPWLRDEFCFRCVYCLRREVWAFQDSDFELDHDVARSIAPELCRDYTNLVYACHNCNKRKGSKRLPSVSDVAYGACMEVATSGTSVGEIHALNDDGVRLIDELSLDGEKITATRRRYIEMIRSLEKNDRPLFLVWMGFPEGLPDLLGVHPQPVSNSLPAGILQSWFAKKMRGALPEIFE
ncbi:MAG: HNH endonuclease [Verrucomicrobiales bacterium]|nr:HNH endonuclease [Verrucomicrobiales bacterium]